MIGVDEVGRGCWAGPLLVVAARAKSGLPRDLKDSKLLTKVQREEKLIVLLACCDFGEGWVSSGEIDEFGLAKALKLGVARSLRNLRAVADERIILDGSVNYLPKKYIFGQVLVGADNSIPIVSAASVYAKVTRDRFMQRLSKKYPQYSFEQHVGYGTASHRAALELHGVIKNVHRSSYLPIANLGVVRL